MTKENEKATDKPNEEMTLAANGGTATASVPPMSEVDLEAPPEAQVVAEFIPKLPFLRRFFEKHWPTPGDPQATLYQALLLDHYKQIYDYTKFHIQLYATLVTLLVGVVTFGFGELRDLKLNLWLFNVPAAYGVFVIALFFAVAGFSGAVVASHIVYTDWNKIFESGSGKSFWDNKWTFLRLPVWVWAKVEHYLFWFGLAIAVVFILIVANSASPFAEGEVRQKAAEYTSAVRRSKAAADKLAVPQLDASRIKDFKATVESVEKVTSGVAIITGENTLVETGIQATPSQGSGQPPPDITKTGRFTAVLLRDGGEWSVHSWNTDLREVK
ncbi:MAG: hypothetical protein M3444_22250 [Acidobacteriota bacterium]|nr:hypothetical protein [Acidobacteriota bacterium]MDQ5837523.1 hypothetical protein [Acidobacteriota bacterium]